MFLTDYRTEEESVLLHMDKVIEATEPHRVDGL
jgi:hypothetical protein